MAAADSTAGGMHAIAYTLCTLNLRLASTIITSSILTVLLNLYHTLSKITVPSCRQMSHPKESCTMP